jgi:hypothetical protein
MLENVICAEMTATRVSAAATGSGGLVPDSSERKDDEVQF